MVKTCVECGKVFITNKGNRLTCSKECAALRVKLYTETKYAKARAATRERIGTKICLICGKEFSPNQPAKVCCSPECQRERDRERVRASNKSIQQRNKKIKSSEKQINDINAKAKAMGMTYGQYVAYIEGKKLWNGSQRKMEH
ncbi:MAG: hypothetical protein IKW21_06170 [Lachnospiraceae bacterium]|nr:hypothetical protein [Lachnospiraceae bacterium]